MVVNQSSSSGSGSSSRGTSRSRRQASESSKKNAEKTRSSSRRGRNSQSPTKMTQKSAHDSESEVLKELLSEVQTELKEASAAKLGLEAEIRSLQRKLQRRDNDIAKQDRELHKLRSVLQEASSRMLEKGDPKELSLLALLHDPFAVAVDQLGQQTKKQGVSGPSLEPSKNLGLNIAKSDKDFRSKQLIREAVMENAFLKKLSSGAVRELIECMQLIKVGKDDFLIREGDQGDHVYVSNEGQFEVSKEGRNLGILAEGKAFGELAVLYDCKRTASVKALTDASVWSLERGVFQQIMIGTGVAKLQGHLDFLRSVPIFNHLDQDQLLRLTDAFETMRFAKDTYIVRQNTIGDTFFVIREGQAQVTKSDEIKSEWNERELRRLGPGDYFGEQALLSSAKMRTANVIAASQEVVCLAFDRVAFQRLIGDIEELQDKTYDEKAVGKQQQMQESKAGTDVQKRNEETVQALSKVRLGDLEVIATLGVGGFGRVELVTLAEELAAKSAVLRHKTFALKCLKKCHIVETQQQAHVFAEKNIMATTNHQFIAKLYWTYRDRKYVYLLIEACLGGEVWTILRDRGWFDDNTARFVVACVLDAIEYLHSRHIIYRDLKPENLLLDNSGYVKLVDFGFSKRVNAGTKTWTFCGTPEYVAPEVILNRGHDRSVDFWALGVLMGELLTGTPPFTASDPMKIYSLILRGVEQLEFPRHVGRTAISLMRKLCKENPAERLGYQKDGILDIKRHRWFQGFDWQGLVRRSLQPPIKPKVSSNTDVSNFDHFPRDDHVPPDELSGWDEGF